MQPQFRTKPFFFVKSIFHFLRAPHDVSRVLEARDGATVDKGKQASRQTLILDGTIGRWTYQGRCSRLTGHSNLISSVMEKGRHDDLQPSWTEKKLPQQYNRGHWLTSPTHSLVGTLTFIDG